MTTWSLQDAKNRFSEVVTAARKSPQTVTKHGKPAVMIVDVEEFERLTAHNKPADKRNFIEHLLAIPKDDGSFTTTRRRPKRRSFDL